jgi:hypothetical protein
MGRAGAIDANTPGAGGRGRHFFRDDKLGRVSQRVWFRCHGVLLFPVLLYIKTSVIEARLAVSRTTRAKPPSGQSRRLTEKFSAHLAANNRVKKLPK